VSPLMNAVRLLPAGIGGILVNVLAAMIMHRVSNKSIMIVGAVAHVVSCALYSATSRNISFWALFFPAQLFAVISQDLEFTVTNMYVMSSLPSEQQSVAGGLFNTVIRLGATVGIGIQTSIYNSAGGEENNRWRPYQATFWVSLVGGVLALGFVPFLTIGRQGSRKHQD
jgi:predicted MFS family arabinose efflux permease